jgi:hypothetical protein
MQLVPHYDDLVGRAAAFVRYVGRRMREEGVPVERTEEVGTCKN